MEAQKVPDQRPDSMRETGTPCRNSPSTLSRVAFSTRQKAANVLSANHRQSAKRRKAPAKQLEAPSNTLRRFHLGETRWQGGQDNAASKRLERCQDAADELDSPAIGANQSGRAAPQTST